MIFFAALYGGDGEAGLLSEGVREALSQLMALFNIPVNGLTPGSAPPQRGGQTGPPHPDHSHRYNNSGRVT